MPPYDPDEKSMELYEHLLEQEDVLEELISLYHEKLYVLNRATQHWNTGSTRKHVIAMGPGHQVYESRVE